MFNKWFMRAIVSTYLAFFGGSTLGAQTIALDFDVDGNGNPLMAGQVITNQYSNLGVTIDAKNNRWWHPDKAIIFDTGNPTGGDFDLQTPGFGAGNNSFLGNALIIAENDYDHNNDGLVDVPDDEARGGYIDFFYTVDQMTAEISLLDIDEDHVSVEIYRDNSLIDSAVAANLGDNSFQVLNLFQNSGAFDQLRVNFVRSGAITNLVTVATPEPSTYLMLGSFLAFGMILRARRRQTEKV